MTVETSAHTIMERCNLLASYSEEPGRLTRRFATSALRQANDTVADWMRTAGMTVRHDPIGNVIGRYEADHAQAKTLLLGSHLDTVRDAGKYDGQLGVLTALACVELLHERNQRLPFALEVLAFADEEGLRYHTSYLGSRVVAGTFEPDLLRLTDNAGITMEEAIRAFGGDPDALSQAKRRSDDLLGYVEVHIEQGPVLESLNLPVGVVSAITGSSRMLVTFTGQAGHAGTVPMSARRDALCAAAEFILAAEKLARSQPGLVATVGQVTVQPGASNVIPGVVILSLDVRHQSDNIRENTRQQLQRQAHQICEARELSLAWQLVQQYDMTPCKPYFTQLLAQSIEAAGYPAHFLASGAGHDGNTMSTIAPIAMLFVRCKGGISHHPDEAITTEDVTVALKVMEHFLTLLAQKREQGQIS
jgi:allantoate deiminase